MSFNQPYLSIIPKYLLKNVIFLRINKGLKYPTSFTKTISVKGLGGIEKYGKIIFLNHFT